MEISHVPFHACMGLHFNSPTWRRCLAAYLVDVDPTSGAGDRRGYEYPKEVGNELCAKRTERLLQVSRRSPIADLQQLSHYDFSSTVHYAAWINRVSRPEASRLRIHQAVKQSPVICRALGLRASG